MNKKLKIVWISNVVFEPYLGARLNELFLKNKTEIDLIYISYEEYAKKVMKCNADYICVCINFESFYPNVVLDVLSSDRSVNDIEHYVNSLFNEMYFYLKTNTNSPILWFGLEDYYFNSDLVCGSILNLDALVDRVNISTNKMIVDDTFIDLKRLISKVGTNNAYTSKGKYRWNAPYSNELIKQISNEIYKFHLRNIGQTKKCLIIDCDNVLWGGILSEDGIEGIHLGSTGFGRQYQDFQRYLLELYYRGVILTICSKNDETDVIKVFREHSGMILKEEHIAIFCVNWSNKAENVKYISDILNIGLDSMVFIDDSSFETSTVSMLLPDVDTIVFNRDSIYDNMCSFNLRNHSDISNVHQRNITYRTNAKRFELKRTSSSFEDYLSKLNINVDIHTALNSEIARISELTQRANKCTNGTRYTIEELKIKMLDSEYILLSVMVSDVFSNLGLVGTIGIYKDTLDLFALSCRALGRGIEDKMIEKIKEYNVNRSLFKSTLKNCELYNKLKVIHPNII